MKTYWKKGDYQGHMAVVFYYETPAGYVASFKVDDEDNVAHASRLLPPSARDSLLEREVVEIVD